MATLNIKETVGSITTKAYDLNDTFSFAGISGVKVKHNNTVNNDRIGVRKIEVLVGGNVFRTFYGSGGNIPLLFNWNTKCDFLGFSDGETIEIDLTQSKSYRTGNPWDRLDMNQDVKNDGANTGDAVIKLDSYGSKKVEVKLYFKEGVSDWRDNYGNEAYTYTKTGTLATVEVKRPVLGDTLVLEGGTRKFFLNQDFSTEGLVIKAVYYKAVSGAEDRKEIVSINDCSVSHPDLSKKENVGSGKEVTVSYSNGAATGKYNIEIVDVDVEKTKKNFTPYDTYYAVGTNKPSKSTVIYYTDGTQSSGSVSVSSTGWESSVGVKTISYSVYDENTKQTIPLGTSKVEFCDYDIVIEANTVNPVTHFDKYANNFSSVFSDYKATKKYKNNKGNAVLTDTVYSDFSANTFKIEKDSNEWSVGNSTGKLIITEKSTDKEVYKYFNVDGLYGFEVFSPNTEFYKHQNFAYGNSFEIVETWYSDGESSTVEITSGFSNYSHNPIDKDTIGEKQVVVTHNSTGLTASYNIEYYEYTNIRVSDNQTDKYIIKDTNSLPNLVIDGEIIGDKDFGGRIETNVTIPSGHYSVSPAVGSTLALGDNLFTITTITDGQCVSNVFVELIQIDDSVSTLSYDGLTENGKLQTNEGVFEVNKEVKLTGLVITAPLMTDGSENYKIKDYDIQLVLHSDNTDAKTVNDLKFNDGDTLGWYDLVITRATHNGTNIASCSIENAVCFKGLVSVSYDETRADNGYFIDGVKVGNRNRVKIGKEIDKGAIKFRKHYSDGSTPDVFDASLITAIKVNSVSKTIFNIADTDDSTNQFIAFDIVINGSSFTMNVPYKYVSAISITNNKTAYDIHDALDTSEITLKKIYKYNSSYSDQEDLALKDVTLSFSGAGTGNSINDLIPEDTRYSASVTLGFAYKEADADQVTTTNVITVKALRGIVICDENGNDVTKIHYEHGAIHSLVGYDFYGAFNTDESIPQTSITEELWSLGDDGTGNYIDFTSTGKSKTFGYSYHGDTKYASYTLHCRYISDISVTFTGVSSSYFVGNVLSVTNITGSKIISSTDSDETSYDYEDENEEIVHVEREYPKTEDITDDVVFEYRGQIVNGTRIFYGDDVGTNNLKATYYPTNGQLNISKTKAIEVVANAIQSIELVTSNTFKSLADYFVGQHLNLAGLEVTIKYNNSTLNHNISYADEDIIILDGNNEEFSKTKQLAAGDDDTTLYVKFTGVDGISAVELGTLTVGANELEEIYVHQDSPHVTDYRYGDKFSIEGLVLIAKYSNGTEETISLNDNELSFTLTTNSTPFNPIGHTFNPTDDPNIADGYIVRAIYLTEHVDFNINIKKPILKEITTNFYDKSEPVRKDYTTADTFSATGLKVKAVFKNDWSINLTDDYPSNVNVSTPSLTSTGYKEVVVSGSNPYNEDEVKTTSFFIEVNSGNAVVSAIMQLEDGFDNYFVGDKFTAKGISFVIKDSQGNSFESKNFTCDLPMGTVLKTAQNIDVKVTYTKGSYTVTETITIKVRTIYAVDLTEENEYRLAIGDANNNLFTEIQHDESVIQFGKQLDDNENVVSECYPLFNANKVRVDTNVLHNKTKGYNIYTGTDAQKDCIGYIDLGIEGVRNAHIVLFDDPVNPIEGNGNIEVTFPHYVEGYADRINQCQFGRIFHNRLFVAGNPNFRNCDWHSGDVNVGQLKENYDNVALHDLTYFSDLDYCYYGNQETAIVGYDQYRDGDLIVIKEGSRNQATIYRREYKLVEATAYDGSSVGENLYEEAFPMFDVNSNGGVGGLSHRSIANFVGETLVLTKNGLKAITNKENAYGNMKFTYDVSSYINPAITKEDLANGILYAFGEKLLLKTNRGLYVGYNELRNDENEYEWYFLNNIEADLFFVIDDELYFANDNGEVFRFPLEEFDYKDKARTFIGVGGTALTISESNDTIVVSSDYASKVKENAPFHLITKYTVGGEDVKSLVHASLGNFVYGVYRDNMINGGGVFVQTAYNGLIDWENSRIILKPFTSTGAVDLDKLNIIKNYFYDGRKVYLDLITSPNPKVNVNVAYYLKRIDTGDFGDITYELEDEYGNKADLSEITTMRVSFAVNHLSITKMTDIQDYGESGAKQFKLIGDHDQVLDLINYNNESYSYAGVITNEDNVKAYFETAPYAMGSIVSLKTIWSWTIVNDTALAGYMDVGFFASRKQGDYDIAVKSVPNSNGFDFSKYSFATVEFLNRKLPATYGRTRTVPSVAYIRYLFKNFEDSNIVLTTLNVVYTIANFLKGVK